MSGAKKPTSAERPVFLEENPTSLNWVKRPLRWYNVPREIRFIVSSNLPAVLMFFLVISVSVLYKVLPHPVYAALMLLLGLAAVTFSLWFPRRTYFHRIYLKSNKKDVDWLKYWNLHALRIGWFLALAGLAGFLTGGLWPSPISTPTLAFGFLPSAALSLLVVYCLLFWRKTSIGQELDEYHPSLAGFVADGSANQIRLPARCHKEDSHNIYLKVVPADTHTSDFWEAELQAVGIKVWGEHTYQHPVASPTSSELLFFWNCKFETPGTFLVNVLLRTKNKQGTVLEVLRKSHEIRVVSLYRQYATSLVAIIVAVLAFLASLRIDVTPLLQSLHF
jgi:hypothetical protein